MKDTTRENMAVMQAHLDGKIIEVRWLKSSPHDWSVLNPVGWNFEEWEYRIQPKKPFECWVNVYTYSDPTVSIVLRTYLTKEKADNVLQSGGKTIHMKQVV